MRKSILTLLVAGALCIAATPAMAQYNDPIGTLTSNASVPEKIEACRVLAQKGTAEAVPALAALLLDEKLSHMARYALEPMPYPEAGRALRDALGKAPNLLKIGIISSLATRGDTQAIPELSALLSHDDAGVAQAAAKALGDLGTPEAATALEATLDSAGLPVATLTVVCDALLACAETCAAHENRDDAAAIYDRLLRLDGAPEFVHAAALRGAVLTSDGDAGTALLLEAIRGDDEIALAAALRTARELSGDRKPVAALAETLDALPDDRKIRVLSVLVPGDSAAGPAVLALAEGGPVEVKVAAIQALTRIGYEPALASIEQWASSEDEALAKAARDSLAYFPDMRGDAVVQAMLRDTRPDARRTAVEMVGEGALDSAVEPLMEAALHDADVGVRVAALTALQDYAGVAEMPLLLERFLGATSKDELQAARAALTAISERQKKMPGALVVEKAAYGDLPDGTSADVTAEVTRLVESGAADIDVSNDNFGDTAPGAVKRLRVDYTVHGTPFSRTAAEGESMRLGAATSSPIVVDAFCEALQKAEGPAKLGMIRLLGSTGSDKAFEAVQAASRSDDAEVKAEALRTLCEWPTPIALPLLMNMAASPEDASLKIPALRGAVRLLGESDADSSERLAAISSLLARADTTEAKMAVLGGLAQVPTREALDLAFAQLGDASVREEAIQAAVAIARRLGRSAQEDPDFFNGSDLAGWTGNAPYWTVEDGAIVGRSDTAIPKNEFLWSAGEVGDFYLVVDAMLEPNTGNAGIQFRSKKINEEGQAQGYQADVGEGYWGRLYHEHGRAMLDDTDAAERAVKPGEWNRYEILAVGPAIWTAINGRLGTAYLDMHPDAEPSGQIAFQIHSGPPLTARYRVIKLVHNPGIALENFDAEDLLMRLKISEK